MTTREGRPSSDLELALAGAYAAGQAVLEWFGSDPTVQHKGPDQPVTAADLRADEILYQRLTGPRPDYGWLSEETPTTDDLSRDRVWVVDPIDGTRSFIEGYREFSVSVGLVAGEDPVIGVVYNPASGEAFWAERGGGAYVARAWAGTRTEGRTISDTTHTDPPPSLLASRSELRRGEFEPFEGTWRVVPLGSTAYKLARVAARAGDAYLSRGAKSVWDVAAGALLVDASGGRATDLMGEPIRLDRGDPYVHGVVAASRPELHGELLERAASLPSNRLRGGGRARET